MLDINYKMNTKVKLIIVGLALINCAPLSDKVDSLP